MNFPVLCRGPGNPQNILCLAKSITSKDFLQLPGKGGKPFASGSFWTLISADFAKILSKRNAISTVPLRDILQAW